MQKDKNITLCKRKQHEEEEEEKTEYYMEGQK
jgi:hypothetical protein